MRNILGVLLSVLRQSRHPLPPQLPEQMQVDVFVVLVLAYRPEEVGILVAIGETRPLGAVRDDDGVVVLGDAGERFDRVRAAGSQHPE